MTDAIQGKLEQAYELIRQEQFEQARDVLQPVLFDSPSADAWWLWANAVSEPEDARQALHQVLRLDPDYEQAKQFLARLDEAFPVVPAAGLDEPDFGRMDVVSEIDEETATYEAPDVAVPDTLPVESVPAYRAADVAPEESAGAEIRRFDVEADAALESGETALDFSDWLEDLAETEAAPEPVASTVSPVAQPRKSYWLRNVLLVLILIAVGLGVALFALNSGGTVPGPQPPALVELPNPSEALQQVLEAAQSGVAAETQALGGEPDAHLLVYQEEPALLIRVCRGAGADVPEALQYGMALAARYGISAQDELSHIGTSLVNCERDDLLVEAYASIADAVAFASGSLGTDAFQSGWTLAH